MTLPKTHSLSLSLSLSLFDACPVPWEAKPHECTFQSPLWMALLALVYQKARMCDETRKQSPQGTKFKETFSARYDPLLCEPENEPLPGLPHPRDKGEGIDSTSLLRAVFLYGDGPARVSYQGRLLQGSSPLWAHLSFQP